ncbi:MAG: hypothetical protein AB8B60_00700 [Sulfitobacter sp.]
MRASGPELAMLACGWAALVLVLNMSLEPMAFGIVFGTIVFAECFSGLFLSFVIKPATAQRWQDVLGWVLLLWTLFCLVFVLLFHLGLLRFYLDQGFAVLACLGLTLAVALLKFFSYHCGVRFLAGLRRFRLVACAVVLGTFARFGTLTLDLALSLALLTCLCLLLPFGKGPAQRDSIEFPELRTDPLGSLWQHADLIMVPVFLSGVDALKYLLARALVQVVFSAFAYLALNAGPQMAFAARIQDHAGFVAVAARLNLGAMLVGGGLCLSALTVAPYFAEHFEVSRTAFMDVLIWMLLAAAAPVFFGATHAVMHAKEMHNLPNTLNFGASLLLCATMLATPSPTAVFLAEIVCILHLGVAACGAGWLALRVGVWPGITAILLRQIKLF